MRFASPLAALTIHFREKCSKKTSKYIQMCLRIYQIFIFSEPGTPKTIVNHILVFGMCPIKYDDCSTSACMRINKYLRILKSIFNEDVT